MIELRWRDAKISDWDDVWSKKAQTSLHTAVLHGDEVYRVLQYRTIEHIALGEEGGVVNKSEWQDVPTEGE